MDSYSQLSEFISSLGKRPGEFTRQELLEIGLNHKDLPPTEKSWRKLCEDTGYAGTAESYRHFVYYHTKNNAEITSLKNSSFDRKSYEQEYKDATKIRDVYNEYRLDLRKEARWETFKDAFVAEVKKLKPLPILPFSRSVNEYDIEKEAILPFADLHLGPKFSNYFNSYDMSTAIERSNALIDSVVGYCMSLNVTKLHFLNMGDLVSGIIHPTIRLGQQQDVISSLMQAAEMVAEILLRLSENIEVVTYRSVIDNHSRLNANIAENLNEENMNRLIDWFVEERLRGSRVKFIHDNIDLQVGKFTLDNGKLIMFAHGDHEKKQSCFQDLVGMTHEFPDYILLAHYHNKAVHTFHGCKVIISGSMIGTDPYAFDHRLFGYPEQSLLIFNGEDLIDISIKLDSPDFMK